MMPGGAAPILIATTQMTVETEKVVFLHVPKTGGAAMEYYLYEQFKRIRRNYFLSFNGVDDSRFIRDERSTARPMGNKCVIERIFDYPSLPSEFLASPHFQEAKVLFGHTTFVLGQVFPGYRFRYLTVLRDPIERTISNICQMSVVLKAEVKFGNHRTSAAKYSEEYWDFIFEILSGDFPIAGLLPHENIYLRNCMTHVLQGSRYVDPLEAPDLHLALANAMRAQVSFFDEFNAGIQRSFNALGVPVDMSENLRAEGGAPSADPAKASLGRYCNAPPRVIEFVRETNQVDQRLYDLISARVRGTGS
jgi:hypothetical protein